MAKLVGTIYGVDIYTDPVYVNLIKASEDANLHLLKIVEDWDRRNIPNTGRMYHVSTRDVARLMRETAFTRFGTQNDPQPIMGFQGGLNV